MMQHGFSHEAQIDGAPAEARRDLVFIQLRTTPDRLRTAAGVLETTGMSGDAFVRRRASAVCDLAARVEAALAAGDGTTFAERRQLLVEAEMLFRWAGGVMLKCGAREVKHMGNNFIQSANNMDNILLKSAD
jgi:hypothetical protein